MWFPQVHHRLDASGEWFASLPQLVVLPVPGPRDRDRRCDAQTPADGYVAKGFGLLVWGFALAGVLPVFAIGGNVDQLEMPTLGGLVTLVSVAFVYLLFRVHRREWLGGPGPLEVHPRQHPEKREGRPPSR